MLRTKQIIERYKTAGNLPACIEADLQSIEKNDSELSILTTAEIELERTLTEAKNKATETRDHIVQYFVDALKGSYDFDSKKLLSLNRRLTMSRLLHESAEAVRAELEHQIARAEHRRQKAWRAVGRIRKYQDAKDHLATHHNDKSALNSVLTLAGQINLMDDASAFIHSFWITA